MYLKPSDNKMGDTKRNRAGLSGFSFKALFSKASSSLTKSGAGVSRVGQAASKGASSLIRRAAAFLTPNQTADTVPPPSLPAPIPSEASYTPDSGNTSPLMLYGLGAAAVLGFLILRRRKK